MTQPLFDTWCSTCSAFSSSIHIDSCFSRPSLSLEIQHAKQSTINSGRPSLSLTSGTRHAPPSISTVHIDGSLGETLDVCEVQAMVISPRTHSQTRRVSRRAIHVTYQRLETCDTCNISKTAALFERHPASPLKQYSCKQMFPANTYHTRYGVKQYSGVRL